MAFSMFSFVGAIKSYSLQLTNAIGQTTWMHQGTGASTMSAAAERKAAGDLMHI